MVQSRTSDTSHTRLARRSRWEAGGQQSMRDGKKTSRLCVHDAAPRRNSEQMSHSAFAGDSIGSDATRRSPSPTTINPQPRSFPPSSSLLLALSPLSFAPVNAHSLARRRNLQSCFRVAAHRCSATSVMGQTRCASRVNQTCRTSTCNL